VVQKPIEYPNIKADAKAKVNVKNDYPNLSSTLANLVAK